MAEPFTWGSALPTLRAGNVVLRALTLPDFEDLFQVFSDPEVMRYRDGVLMRSLSDASAYIAGVQRGFEIRQLFEWGVTTATDDRVIGTCTLFRLDDRHRRAEIGFALGRAFWGQGLGSSAVARLVTFAFEELDLLRLEADADPRNARSLRLLERLGFKREGLLRARYLADGEVQDAVALGLLRREWLGR
jgi:ribosomal-protein-alanine N-acetyltransferase